MDIQESLQKLKLYKSLMILNRYAVSVVSDYDQFLNKVEHSGLTLKQILFLVQKGNFTMSKIYQTIVWDLLETNTFNQLEQLLLQTPKEVVEMLHISGLGPRKVCVIWHDMGVTTLEQLAEVCKSNKLLEKKGFGLKTQTNILTSVTYYLENRTKLLMPDAELFAEAVVQEILDFIPDLEIHLVGDIPRGLPVVSKLELVIHLKNKIEVFQLLNDHDLFEPDLSHKNEFIWVGFLMDVSCPIHVIAIDDNLGLALLKLNSSEAYFNYLMVNTVKNTLTEKDVYQQLTKPFVPIEAREIQNIPFLESSRFNSDQLVKNTDLNGCLHNHSTYSDGKHSVFEMAASCKQLGMSYFGVSDHSKSAFYANGLTYLEIEKQHQEIDDWNVKSSSFHIFKGIESDILPNGNLDYEPAVLKKFDFIIASVHANLSMTKQEATSRLIKAIENPFTTILGHPTGRLLLKRTGYEVDYAKIIDACFQNNVCIEINANPSRLDLDWSYVRYAADKGVMLTINPDAHCKEAILDMQYGIKIARKGALYPNQILNCKTLEEITDYFSSK